MYWGFAILDSRSGMNPPQSMFIVYSASTWPLPIGVNRHVLFMFVTRKQQSFDGVRSGAAAYSAQISLVRGI